MAKITSLLEKLRNSDLLTRLPYDVTIESGTGFSWQYASRVITYDGHDPHAPVFLLHEVAHALLGHQDYRHDVHLIEMERAAWDKASEIAPQFAVLIEDDIIEDTLDSYRNWLHSRSLCPHCGSTGVQEQLLLYSCLACHHEWRVNEARTCQLRRYQTKKRP